MNAYRGVLGTEAGSCDGSSVTQWGISIKWGVKPVTPSLAVNDLLCVRSLLPSVQRPMLTALTVVRPLCGLSMK